MTTDADADADRLVGFDLTASTPDFAKHVPTFAGQLTGTLLAGGRPNLTFRLADGKTEWVLRRPPLGPLTPTARDMTREYRMVAALARTGFPVPEAVLIANEDGPLGVPLAVYCYVEGPVVRIYSDAVALGSAAPSYVKAMLVTLAALHHIAPEDAGPGRRGRPDGYLEWQLNIWIAQWPRVTTSHADGVNALHHDLEAALSTQDDARDFRLDNTIVAHTGPSHIRAVVDWEMATISDLLSDLGLLSAYWDPVIRPLLSGQRVPSANPQFGSAEDVIELYVRSSGQDMAAIALFQALALLKVAVIAEGIHQRFLTRLAIGKGFEQVGLTPTRAVDRGRAVVAGLSL